MNPIVSIIVPTFNSKQYISETLKSVISQTYIQWECIIVDDGSTDGTEDQINLFSNDPRIIFFRRNRCPKGVSTCRNIGIDKARGEFIIFLDSDDLLSPNCLKNRTQKMIEQPALEVGIFNTSIFKSNIFEKSAEVINKEISINPGLMYLGNELPFTVMSPIWKASLLKKYGGFREYFQRFEDPEFFSRIFCLGKPNFHYFDHEPDNFYRKTQEKNISSESAQKGYLHFYRNWCSEIVLIKKENRTFARKQLRKFSNRLIKDYFIYYCNNNYKLSWLTLRIGFRGHIYSFLQYQFIIFYLLCCKYGLYKIRGFGWFAKKIIFK